jgi:hypothetical protein
MQNNCKSDHYQLKGMLSNYISKEQFGFLFNRQIHDAVCKSHERLHIIKIDKLSIVVLKINLSKAFDKVS